MKICNLTNLKRPAFLMGSFILFLAGCMSASAQSTDRDNPTPLTTNEIRGKGITNKVYYYKFDAGPGELVLTVDGKTDAYTISLAVELFTPQARRLGAVSVQGDHAGQRKIARIDVPERTTVIMRLVQDTRFSAANSFEYLVRVGGALHLPKVGGGTKPKTTAQRPVTNRKERVVSTSRKDSKPGTTKRTQTSDGPRAAIGRP